MVKNYTLEAKQRCFELVDDDIEAIWKDIEQIPLDTDADKWKKKLQLITKEYTFSSRFALLRIFLNRAPSDLLKNPDVPSEGFSFAFSDGTVFSIEDISMEHVKNLSEEDLTHFMTYLLDQASRQSDADYSVDYSIIKKAMSIANKKTTLLSRDEALQLGHILQFTLQEMEWFLLRVFDSEDGFCYNLSSDLIEAYGFLSGISWKSVNRIKDEYNSSFGHETTLKISSEEKSADWTKDTGESLPEKVHAWTIYNSINRDSNFLQWLGEKSPYLDIPSQTALRVYRNLAVFASNLVALEEETPEVDTKRARKDGLIETDFLRCIREIVRDKTYADQTVNALFENGEVSEQKCNSVAYALLKENQQLYGDSKDDMSHLWRTVRIKQDGKISVNDGKKASRSRVRDILYGKVERVEKNDLLFLLWFTSNLCWLDGKSALSPDEISNRLNDFIDASELCLNAAGLPGFYPPHLVEQSMMLSIIYAFKSDEQYNPAEVYEDICQSVIERRISRKKKNEEDHDRLERGE